MSKQQPERRPGNGDGQEAPHDSTNPDTLHTGQTQSTTESSANTDYPYDPSDQFIQWNTIPGAVASIGDVPPDRRGEQPSSEYDPNLVPNPKFLAQMIEMGIPESSAIQALIHTKNYSAEMAISWVFEQSDSQQQTRFRDEPSEQHQTSSGSRSVLDDEDPSTTCKMVFVVNTDLGMKIGKTCAQVAHATLGLHQIMIQNERTLGDDMVRWLEYGQAKICLRADNTQHLLELQKNANALNLPSFLVQDAGRTQIPAGSFTVLSIFGKISVVNQVTGTLRLL